MLSLFVLLWCLVSPRALARAQLQAKVLKNLTGQVRFSPDGHSLISYDNTTLQFWSPDGQNLQRQLNLKHPIMNFDLTPDGRFVALSQDDGHYSVWRSRDLKQMVHIRDRNLDVRSQPFALSPDGLYLTICTLREERERLSAELHIWDLRQHRLMRTAHLGTWPNELPGHFPSIELAYHPLGRYLTVGVEWTDPQKPRYLQVWDTWKASWTYWVHGSPPLSYSHNGKYFSFAAIQGKTWQMHLWHTPTNLLKTVPKSLIAPSQSSAVLSASGRYLVLATAARYRQHLIQVVNTATLKTQIEFEAPEAADSFSFSPDEKQLLLSSRQDAFFKPLLYRLP